MKKSEILQAAIDKYLWDGNPKTFPNSHTCLYTCIIEYRANFLLGENFTKANEIIFLISKRVYPHLTVANWLSRVAKIPLTELTDENIQAYRKRWAESLIEEFKAQGD